MHQVKADKALRIEDEMLYVLLLAFFLIQFFVIAGVIVFAIVFSRPEVPLKGDGGLERTVGNRAECTLPRQGAGRGASEDSRSRMNRLMIGRPVVFEALSSGPGGQSYQGSVQGQPW